MIKIPSECKMVVFDLDNTLHNKQTINLEPHIYDIIKHFKDNGVKVALVSLNLVADYYLEKYMITHLFDCIKHRDCTDIIKIRTSQYRKDRMFKSLQKQFDIPFTNMILFDDCFYNCMEARSLGMKFVVIPRDNSVTSWKDVRGGMSLFGGKRRKSCEF